MGKAAHVARVGALLGALALCTATAGVGPLEARATVGGPRITLSATDPSVQFGVRFTCVSCADDHGSLIKVRFDLVTAFARPGDRIEARILHEGMVEDAQVFDLDGASPTFWLEPFDLDLCPTGGDCFAETLVELHLVSTDAEVTLDWAVTLNLVGDGEPNDPPPRPGMQIVPP